ncbi:MAG TPA: hypothetical protein VGB57_03305, partial [Allosphingosinicella sp.]
SLSESSIEVGSGGDRVEALLITLDGLPPAGIDPPSVDIPGYIAQRTSTATGFTFTYVASEGDPDAAGSKMAYLPAEKGQQIGQRKITLPGLNILAAQNASSSGWILRNQHLVERRTTVESFLYQTSPVSFPTPLRPTFVVLEEIDIAAIPTGGPVARTLAEQLGGLFTALFAEAPAGPQEIQLTICYSVSVNPALPPIALPVVFVPPIAFLPDNEFNSDAEDGDPLSQAALSQKIATAITTWYQTNAPLQGGTLTFDLKVMTRQPPGGGSAPPTPLLELAYLVLNYADWTDHPADQVN